MKTNSKYFYTFVKNKVNKKTNVGPFIDDKGNVINEKPADTLQKQYESVWPSPLEDKAISDPDSFFYENNTTDNDTIKPKITKAYIDKIKIRKAIKKLKNNAAPGPNGVPVSFLKTFYELILEPLEIIYQNSIDTKIFPKIWKRMYINPIKKTRETKIFTIQL